MRTRRRAAVLLLAVALLGCSSPAQERATSGARPDASPRQTSPSPTSPSTTSSTPVSPSPAATPAARDPERRPAAPTSLSIASIGLEEELVELGIAGNGELEVPADPARVGWFSGGGRPGGSGPTVVVGHLDSTEGPAVFARLPELGPGDEIEVGTGDGVVTYVVQQTADVPQQGFPTEQVFGATSGDVLRLITCTGPYDATAGRYTENRVVTALPRT